MSRSVTTSRPTPFWLGSILAISKSFDAAQQQSRTQTAAVESAKASGMY
jgi:hypothetical protein